MIWQDVQNLIKERKNDGPFALFMFAYFFLVIVTFWIYKPIKKTVFVKLYDKNGFDFFGHIMTASQAELLVKTANLFIAVIAMYGFTLLSRKFKKEKLGQVILVFFFIMNFVFAGWLTLGIDSFLAWSLYMFGDLFVMVMVACFFAFLNDSVDSQKAKKIYSVIVLGGVIGGVVGSTTVRVWIETMANHYWMLICAALTAVLFVVAGLAGKYVQENEPALADKNSTEEEQTTSWLSSAKMVFSSKYLFFLASIVIIYEITSQIMDFQFTSAVSHYLNGKAIGAHFAHVYFLVNIISCTVQVLVTPFLLKRGIRFSLAVLPLLILATSAGFVAVPILWLGSALAIIDNAINYSLNQSAKENLYVPLTRKEKYEVKAFIDIFGVRFGKVLAIVVSLVVTTLFTGFESIRWLSFLVIPLVLIWLYLAWYVGSQCDKS